MGLQRKLGVELAASQPNHQLLEGGLHLVDDFLELRSLHLLLADDLLELVELLDVVGRIVQQVLPIFGLLFEQADTLFQVFVAIDEVVDVLVEHIHVRQQSVVLLLALDKGVLDFVDVADSRRLLDLAEGFIDDLHVALVAVYQLDLFLIVVDQL